MLFFGSIGGAVGCVLFIAQRVVSGTTPLALIPLLVALLGFLSGPVLLKKTGNSMVSGTVVVCAVLIAIATDCVTLGGLGSPPNLAAIATPIFAAFFLGQRAGWVVAGMVSVLAVVLFSLEVSGALPTPAEGSVPPEMYLVSTIFIALFVAAFASEFDRQWATEHRRIERLHSHFVTAVSHELRSPLTSIRGALGLVLGDAMGKTLTGPQRELLTIAEANCERLNRRVDDLIDVQKLEAGQMAFDMSPVPVAALVTGVVQQAGPAARRRGCDIQTSLELPSDASLHCDGPRVRQALDHVLDNALKYSPADNAVTVRALMHNSRVRFEVANRGPGIAVDFQPHVFERFAQESRGDARSATGNGLGLALAKAIVERHGGTIGFDTEPGEGTCFWFEIPAT